MPTLQTCLEVVIRFRVIEMRKKNVWIADSLSFAFNFSVMLERISAALFILVDGQKQEGFPVVRTQLLVVFVCTWFAASTIFAQETFTYQLGGAEPANWETPSNWAGGSGLFSAWPGDAPEAGTLDSANLATNHAGDFSIEISTPGLTLDVLTLGSATGDHRTTINGAAGATLSVEEIRTSSSSSLPHDINIDFIMPTTELELPQEATQTPIHFNGSFLNQQPVSNSYRIVDNQSRGVLHINGAVSLSNTSTSGSLLFRNGGQPTFTIINGVIEDGTAPGGRVSYVRGLFQINNANTYSGETLIGANSPDVETQVEINNDQAFGVGTIISGGGPEEATIRSSGGTRTLANDIRLARDLQFAGSHSFVLNGQIHQSNSRELLNDIAGIGKTLTINGDIFASDDGTSRPWVFEGTGKTIVKGAIHDSLFSVGAAARLVKNGTGTVVLNAASDYSGITSVNQGSLVVNNPSGSATGNGAVTVGSSATLLGKGTINGDVTIEGGGQLAPGDGLGVLTLGAVTLAPGAQLQIELAGVGGVAGVDFDQLQVGSAATLAGNLEFQAVDGFSPLAGDRFPIIEAASISGDFDSVTFPGLADQLFGFVSLSVNTVELIVTFGADFDRDLDVDGNDLLAIQREIPALLSLWEAQYGSDAHPLASSQPVPEPTSLLLALTLVLAVHPLRKYTFALSGRQRRV